MASKKITELDPLGTKPSDTDLLVVVDLANNKTKKLQVNKAMEAAPVQSVNGADGAVTFDYVESINGKKGVIPLLKLADIEDLLSELARIEAKIGGGGKVKPFAPPEAAINITTTPPTSSPTTFYFGTDLAMDDTGTVAKQASNGAQKNIVAWDWTIPLTGGTKYASDNVTHTLPAGNTNEKSRPFTIELTVTDNAKSASNNQDAYNEQGTVTKTITLVPAPLEEPKNQTIQIMLLNANFNPILRAPKVTQAAVQWEDFNASPNIHVWNIYN